MPATRVDDETDEGAVKTGKGSKRPASLEDFPITVGGLAQPGERVMGEDDAQRLSVRERLRELDLSDIDEMEREELRVRQEEKIEKAKTRLSELKQRRESLERGGRGYSPQAPQGAGAEQAQGVEVAVDPEDAKIASDVAEMDEDKQQRFLDIYTRMQAAKNPNGMGMFLPSLLSYSKAPDTSASDVTKVGEAMVGAMKSGMEMVQKAQSAKNPEDSSLAAVVLKLIDRLDRPAQPQSGSAVALIKDLADAGLVYTHKDMLAEREKASKYGGAGELSASAIEMERLRMDQQVKLEEIRNSTQMELAKLGIDSKRTDAIAGGFTKLLSAGGRALASGETDELEEKGHGMPADASGADIEEVECPNPACKATITVPEPQVERDLTCPHCSKTLHYRWIPK